MEQFGYVLSEINECLKENNKTTDMIKWVGSSDGKLCVSWERFIDIINKEKEDYGIIWDENIFHAGCSYDIGNVADDLIIVGDGWWISKHSDSEDGDYWDISIIPVLSLNCQIFDRIIKCDREIRDDEKFSLYGRYFYDNLQEINDYHKKLI